MEMTALPGIVCDRSSRLAIYGRRRLLPLLERGLA